MANDFQHGVNCICYNKAAMSLDSDYGGFICAETDTAHISSTIIAPPLLLHYCLPSLG